MSLDVDLVVTAEVVVYGANITHNLGKMADAAGIYKALWRPEEIGITTAKDLIPILEKGIENLKNDPDKFKTFNPANGWGSYDAFLPWVKNYLRACKEHPEAKVTVSR